MPERRTDNRPLLERATTLLWFAGLAAVIAVVVHFAADTSKPVTALIYVLVLSLITFLVFWIDKRRSTKSGARRVTERLLLGLSLFGGAGGGLLAMSLVRHKTKHLSFKILLPLFALVHLALLLWLSGWFDSAT